MLKYLLLLIVLLVAVVSARNLNSQCDFDTTSCDPCPGLLSHYEYNEFKCPISCECVHDPDMLFEGDIKLEGRSLALANKLYGISSDDDASYGLTNNNGLFWPKSSDTVVVPYTIHGDLECKNVQSDHKCERWKALGFCSSTSQFYPYMNANCKHTCGFCRGCENKYADSSCEVWMNVGYCSKSSQYFQQMRYHCRRTCGRCFVCENTQLDTTCASWKTRGYCSGVYAHYTRAYCKGTCGLC